MSAEFRDALDKDEDEIVPMRDVTPVKPQLFGNAALPESAPVEETQEVLPPEQEKSRDVHAELSAKMDETGISFAELCQVIQERKMSAREFGELSEIPSKVVDKLLANWEQVRMDLGK